MPERVALYPGSFDPLTNGHLDVLEHRCESSDLEVSVSGDRDVVLGAHPGRGEPNVAAGAAHDLVAENCEPARELLAAKVPRQLHTARTSSRTKWRRTRRGRSGSSKWHRTASWTLAFNSSSVSPSVKIEWPSARAS